MADKAILAAGAFIAAAVLASIGAELAQQAATETIQRESEIYWGEPRQKQFQ